LLSLRERLDDIPLLVEYFIDRYAKKAGKNFSNMTNKTFQLFQAYDWPGNIRELRGGTQIPAEKSAISQNTAKCFPASVGSSPRFRTARSLHPRNDDDLED
jgi:transcriptional regulator with PAS, ATPase and Fis domain